MAKEGRVVLNCVGPYRFSGRQVVDACIEAGTNCVDVSGEPEFLESVQLNCNEQAEKKGVYIVGACGFDSIPADLGVVHLIKNFGGGFNKIASTDDEKLLQFAKSTTCSSLKELV